MAAKYWLMKAEPDSRIVKGKEVKFSIDDFESVKTTPWEGVRNHEAKNLMKEMKIRDKVLFYHSNCKTPGIAGFAEVSKEAYPDYTAWDTTHPYYDAKTKQDDPKWYMVDLTFVSRATHFVPLALLKYIAGGLEPPADLQYIGEQGVKAIKGMALVRKARLSVQRVDERTWDIVEVLAEKGGWEKMDFGNKKVAGASSKTNKGKGKKKARGEAEEEAEEQSEADEPAETQPGSKSKDPRTSQLKRKRKAKDLESDMEGDKPLADTRRSTRARK